MHPEATLLLRRSRCGFFAISSVFHDTSADELFKNDGKSRKTLGEFALMKYDQKQT